MYCGRGGSASIVEMEVQTRQSGARAEAVFLAHRPGSRCSCVKQTADG